MPRDLQESNANKATFMDGPSGGEVSLYYRTPTNKERIAFESETISKKASKITSQAAAAQLKYGSKVLTGIEDGDFLYGGKPISSNEESEDYNPDWKRLVQLTAGDLVQALALLVFSGIVLKYEGEHDTDGDGPDIDMTGIPGLEPEIKEPGQADAEDAEKAPLG